MAQFRTPDVLPGFNAALNACKGGKSEEELAEFLGTTSRSLAKWRRGQVPTVIVRLMKCPDTLVGLAHDANSSSDYTQKTSE